MNLVTRSFGDDKISRHYGSCLHHIANSATQFRNQMQAFSHSLSPVCVIVPQALRIGVSLAFLTASWLSVAARRGDAALVRSQLAQWGWASRGCYTLFFQECFQGWHWLPFLGHPLLGCLTQLNLALFVVPAHWAQDGNGRMSQVLWKSAAP